MNGKDFEELRQLVEFLKASGIAEFEMERPEMKVRLNFASEPPAAAPPTLSGLDLAQLARLMASQGSVEAPPAQAAAPLAAPAPAAAAPGPETAETEVDPNAGAHVVKSPIVGTFYDAPSPDSDPFVRVGDRVSAGQVLCIVEAMKLMNEIESDAEGEIVKIFVEPGQPVEYGQALYALKK